MSVELLSGWGRTAPTAAQVTHPCSLVDLQAALVAPPGRGVLARGLGRSYGDAASNAGGLIIDATGVDDVLWFDDEQGRVRVAAGASLDGLLRRFLPQGWFLPVTPGTRQVTVGGAMASDIHGKDHHRTGTWASHVEALTLVTPAEGVATIGPDADADLFWATAGGMGLTGVVVDTTVRLVPVETSRLCVDTDRTRDLDDAMALMEAEDELYPYSVAWIDLLAKGAALGRAVLTRGRFARREELDRSDVDDALTFSPRTFGGVAAFHPPRLLNRATVRTFNEFWYRRSPRRRRDELQTVARFFHPLDCVADWNRLYGPRGLVQWQCLVPFGAEGALRDLVASLSAVGCPSFLAVLKRFGSANPGPMSFPAPGWTLALDVSAEVSGLGPLLDRLDDAVVAAGGRVYLAKDSRLRPQLLDAMYPRLDEWREVRGRVDPSGTLRSDLGRRLRLC